MKEKKKLRKYGIKNFAKRTIKELGVTNEELGIGDRRSSVPLDNTTQIIHAMQAASRAHNWQTFPVSGKSKLSRRSTHRLWR